MLSIKKADIKTIFLITTNAYTLTIEPQIASSD